MNDFTQAVLFAAPLIALCAALQWRANRLARTLNALRANCFLTNERGNRVRYINASPELRAKAEGEV